MALSEKLFQELRGLHNAKIDLSLERIARLLRLLGNPHKSLPSVIHVAGTNGKGSTITFLRAILEAAHFRVHSFTSPPLGPFHTSLRLAKDAGVSEPIGEEELCQHLGDVLSANEGSPLTRFEGETASALLAMSRNPADMALIEVGLGGIADATNVVESPVCTIITPIGFDHTDHLGPELRDIAEQKAGIIKAGAPCIVARQEDGILDVLRRRAAERRAKLHICGIDWDVYEQQGRMVFQDEHRLLDLPLPALRGRHQIENAGLAIAALGQVKLLDVPETAFTAGMTGAEWPARMQPLGTGELTKLLKHMGSEIWLDGGHNRAAARALANAIAELEERDPKPLHLIVGMLKGKDVRGFLNEFNDMAELLVGIDMAEADNAYAPALTGEDIIEAGDDLGMLCVAAGDLSAAFEHSQSFADGPVRLLICGSLHLAQQVLEIQNAAPGGNGKI